MKKLLSLILGVLFVFACVPLGVNSDMISGCCPELIITSAAPAEHVQNVIYTEQNASGFLDQETYKRGDLNGDGAHDYIDYILLKRAFIGTGELADTQRSSADINGDGSVGCIDCLMLKRSAMKTYNIKQPQTLPDELEISDMAYGYYEYKKTQGSFQWMPFEASDVTILKNRVYGAYGNGNCFIVFGLVDGYGHLDGECEIEVGGRRIVLPDSNEPLVWDGSTMYDIWTAYDNGLIDDVDLEDFQAR